MKSSVIDLATVVAGLGQVDAYLEQSCQWRPESDVQARLLEIRREIAADVSKLRHLDSMASNKADQLNAFLAARSFDYRFSAFAAAEDFGVACTLTERTAWPRPGDPCQIDLDGNSYQGFLLDQRGTYWQLADGRRLINLGGAGDDESWMWIIDGIPDLDPTDPFAAFEDARRALKVFGPGGHAESYKGLPMPEERLDSTFDLPWLEGLSAPTARISKAVSEAHLRVDRYGSEARVASMLAVRSGPAPTEWIEIRQPHVVFWTDATLPSLPLAVAHFHPDAWSPYSPADEAESR